MTRDTKTTDPALSRHATWGDLEAQGQALEQAIESLKPIFGTPVYYIVVGDDPGTYRSDLPRGVTQAEVLAEIASGVTAGNVTQFELGASTYTGALLRGSSGESFGWLISGCSSSRGQRALVAAAREVGDSFEQAWLLRCANYDGLTRLPNRRYLERLLIDGFEESQRRGESYSIAFVDLDHFKQVNDTRGHDVGDAVLREAAERLSSSIREGEALGRWGGEEFVVGLSGLGADEAKLFAERLSLAIGLAPMKADIWITASIGIASAPIHGDSLGALLRAADAALYQAKEAGRNRVVVSGGDSVLIESGEEPVATWLTSRELGKAAYPLIPGTRYLLGRSIHCDVRLEDPSVSRVHAAIRVDQSGKIYLADQCSFNGVLRNDRRIERAVELRVGDRVQVGRYRFEVEANEKSLNQTLQTTACRNVSVCNLAKTTLSEVLASAKRRRLTCSFHVASRGGRGKISIERGEVVHAAHGELEGTAAIEFMSSLREGLCVLS